MDFIEFVEEICEDYLEIEVPRIILDPEKIRDNAYAYTDGTSIYIKEPVTTYDGAFSIAHELRHIWQIRTDKDYFTKNYMERSICKDTEAYNRQLAEIDANAFALIVMNDFFGIRPLFKGYSEELRDMIYEYAEKIIIDT